MQNEKQNYKVTNLVGAPTDYSDENNWAHLPENTDKAVDTFFIYPTVHINLNRMHRKLFQSKIPHFVPA